MSLKKPKPQHNVKLELVKCDPAADKAARNEDDDDINKRFEGHYVEPTQYLFGIELTNKYRRHILKTEIPQNDIHTEKVFRIQRVTLGADAQDNERNIVFLKSETDDGHIINYPVVNLRAGFHETATLELELLQKLHIEFHLVIGCGPVVITGEVRCKRFYDLKNTRELPVSSSEETDTSDDAESEVDKEEEQDDDEGDYEDEEDNRMDEDEQNQPQQTFSAAKKAVMKSARKRNVTEKTKKSKKSL